MKRTLHIIALWLFCAFTLLSFKKIEAQNKPNIVVILADDMGFSDIASYGGEIQTPNLDELADDGIRFRRFYNTTKCSPTRASLLTGQYPHEAGMENLSNAGGNNSAAFLGYLPNNVVTMAEVFKQNGYGTYMSGKWHIGEDQGNWPRDRGFDKYWGLISGASSYYEVITMDENPNQKSDRKIVFDDRIWDPDDTSDPDNPYAPGEFYMTDATSDFALDFLQDHLSSQANKPFFLYLSFTAPHWPLHAPESVVDKYEGAYSSGFDVIRQDRFNKMKMLGVIGQDAELSPRDHNKKWENLTAASKADFERRMEVYAAMTDRMDENIGRVMNYLKGQGKFNNTIFVFLSDNGGSREDVSGRKLDDPSKDIGARGSYVAYLRPWSNVSNVPFREHKNDTYEGGIVTPFIIHHPASINVPNGGAFTDQIAHVKDVLPTLLEMTNSNYPSNYNGASIKPMSGESFKHILDDVDNEKQWEIFFEYSGNRAVRHGKWKIVSESVNGEWFLFDVEDDPTELSNLRGSYPELVDQLAKRYNLWEIGVNHKNGSLPNPNNPPVLLNPLEDQVIREERLFTYVFDKDAFTDDPDDDIVYEATLSNGDPLPNWLEFDDLLRQFSGVPPEGSLISPIEIRLIAIDWAKNKTIDQFKLILDPNNNNAPDPTALLVVDDRDNLNGSDADIKERLEMLGYLVTTLSDEEATEFDASDKNLAIISSTVSPGKVLDKFKQVNTGVLTWEVSLFPEMGMTGTVVYQDYGGKGSQTNIVIENDAHPLAAGLSAGDQVVMNKNKTFYFGVPSSQSISVASLVGRSDRKTIFAYDVGANMADGTNAAGRRVGFFMGDQGARDFNNNGWALFDAAVCWLSDECSSDSGISINFTTPMDMESFPDGTDLSVQVAASDSDGTISRVQLFLNGTSVRIINNPPYVWNAANDPLLNDMTPGDYTLQAVATDSDDNTENATIKIMIEPSGNQDPIVSFDAPMDGDSFDEGHDLNVRVNASDPDGSISSVMLYFDGTLVGNDSSAPYEWGNNGNDPLLQNLQVGTHTLRAVAMDNEGSASETTISITVSTMASNQAPVVSFVEPADGQNFPEGIDLTVRVNASDSDGTVSSVKLYLDGQLVSEDTSAPYEWSNEPLLNNLTQGTYTLLAEAIDDDNAVSQSSIQINVIEAGGNILPTTAFITPQHGDNFPVGTDLLVQVAATDTDGEIRRVHLYLNGEALRRDEDAPYEWDGAGQDMQLSNLQAGTYILEAAAVDDQNEFSQTTITITVGGDNNTNNQPPILSFDTPMDGDNFPVGTDLYVKVDASDSDGTVEQVELFFDGTFVRAEGLAPYEWGQSTQNDVLLNNLQAGTYSLRAVATDDDNATSEEIIMITVGSNPNMLPEVSITNPADGAVFTEGDDVLVQANASDMDGSISNVQLYFDGNLFGTDSNPPYQWNVQNLTAGTHTFRVLATDNDGGTSEETINISVNGLSQNQAPTISFISPSDGDTFNEGTDLYVNVDANDSDGSISSVDLYLDGQFVRSEMIAPYEWGDSQNNDPQLQNLSPGTHTLQAIATDNEGATAEQSIQIEVLSSTGNTLPVVTFIEPIDGGNFPVGTDLYIKVDAYDPNGSIRNVRMYINGDQIRRENFAPYEWGDPNQNADPELQNLAAGTYELTAVASDNSGERTQESIIITVGGNANTASTSSVDNNHSEVTIAKAERNKTASKSQSSNETEARSTLLEPLSEQIHIYPNPTSEHLIVDVKNVTATQLDFLLYDAFGRILRVRTTDFSDTLRTSWNVEELPAGIYLLQIRADKRLIKVEKVVISR